MDRRFDIWRRHRTVSGEGGGGGDPPYEIPNPAYVSMFSAGDSHTLILTDTGQVYSFGSNNFGELGRVAYSSSETANNIGLIPGLTDVVEVSAGENISLFRLSDGSVWGAGNNSQGALVNLGLGGNETTSNLGQITGLPAIKMIVAGTKSTFFLSTMGEVYSAGVGVNGELGRDNTTEILGKIPGLSNVYQVASGAAHTLFLLKTGLVYGCGNDMYGQLNNFDNPDGWLGTDIRQVKDLSNIIQIAAGEGTSFFLRNDGKVFSCGDGERGKLGKAVSYNPETGQYEKFGIITGLSNIIQISSKGNHTTFVDSSHHIFNCGSNIWGQLAREVMDGDSFSPNLGQITGFSVTAASAGVFFSVFKESNGSYYSCGTNYYGQLGRIIASGNESTINLGIIII
jgi:alpha-tubulin suppressor-like RCC1 family protein